MAMVKTYENAFQNDSFINHVSDALKRNYDEKRYVHLLQMLSTPLAKKMAYLESIERTSVDVQNFSSQIVSNPLPPDRIMLIQKIDSTTQSSMLMTKITIASIEAFALEAAGDCDNIAAQAKKTIEKNRPDIEKVNHNSELMMLAFTYRDVTDVDLDEYLKIYEDKDSKWVQDIILVATEEQFKSSIGKAVQGIGKYIQAHKRKRTMFAPKCGEEGQVKEGEGVL